MHRIGRYLTRNARTVFPAFASVCIIFTVTSMPKAQDAERPLGILLPGVQQPAPRVGSPIPEIYQRTSASPAIRDTSRVNDSNSANSRPLGNLLNSAAQPAQKTGSLLPPNWATSPQNAGPTTSQGAPRAAASSEDRPLGTLINLPQAKPANTNKHQQATSRLQAREIRPARRVYAQPTSDATNAKPLGTLFGKQPDDMTIDTSSEETRPSQPAPAVRSNAAPQPTQPGKQDALRAELNADSMTYDRDLGLITATGNVEIEYGPRSLLADKVTYNQKADIVLAEGNVSMTDETGKVIFGDRVEITGDLKDGVIHNIGLVLEDKSRVAGAGAHRTNGIITEVDHAVYSPCNLCKDDPTAPPLWQIKAVRVIHDAEERRVSYRNAWLELYGIPVAYTPYLSHPDPTVKRRSGFLAPSLSNSSDLGVIIQAPYFWAIDEYQDATITPRVTTDGGQGANGQFRRNFKKGRIKADGSFVVDDPDRGTRGYIDIESEYHIDPTWRAGIDIETASDDTYTRRYGIDTESVLVSRGYLEGFRGNNYQVLNTYGFNDLRADTDESPIVLPMYDFNYNGRRDRLGGYASFDFNALNLARSSGTDTRRLAFRPRWDRPFNGSFGEVYNASVSLAADAYHATNVTLDNGSTYTGTSGHLMPRAALSWRLPLIRPGEHFSQTIEPLASFVVSPNGGNSDKTPNEDSQEVEFDETNLFQENRYDGFDRVDGGTRVNYGLNWALTGNKGGYTSVFLGQSYRLRKDSSYNQSSGLEDNFSDVVGRVQISPQKYLDLIYRTQFSPDNQSPQRNELTANIGSPALNMNMDYIFLDSQQGSEFAGREEINGALSSQINKNWSSYFSARHDLSASDIRSLALGIVYEDECVKFTSKFTRSFFEDRDIKPADAVTFTLVLKTLGEVHSGASLLQ